MKKQTPKHYIEILPAALLAQRRARETPSDNLLEGAWLLVLPKTNNNIYQVILDLARTLEEKGKRVVVL